MPQWIRPLDQSAKGAAEWHVSRIKSYTTTAYCGKVISGTLEVTNDDNAAGGRCKQCLAASAGSAPQKQASPRKKTAAKSTTKKTIRKRQPKAR